jgi:hypothetical protein
MSSDDDDKPRRVVEVASKEAQERMQQNSRAHDDLD